MPQFLADRRQQVLHALVNTVLRRLWALGLHPFYLLQCLHTGPYPLAPGLVGHLGIDPAVGVQGDGAGSNQATATTWVIGNDMEKVVQALKSKGVGFEHYNLPGMTLKGDIHVADGMKAAWFKDPDGNIHALVSG